MASKMVPEHGQEGTASAELGQDGTSVPQRGHMLAVFAVVVGCDGWLGPEPEPQRVTRMIDDIGAQGS
eukprot:56869-Rhodomonas_salina.1